MKTPQLNRCDVPPPVKDVLYVQRLKGDERGQFILYSPAMWGVWTHFHNGRTQPCFENHDLCYGGHQETNLRWKGYVHCWSFMMGRQVILQFTENAARQLLSQLPSGCSLRGKTIEAARSKKSKGRMNVELDRYAMDRADGVPPAIDPLKSIFNMWGIPLDVNLLSRSLVTSPAEVPDAA